jgi:hypothetical protein
MYDTSQSENLIFVKNRAKTSIIIKPFLTTINRDANFIVNQHNLIQQLKIVKFTGCFKNGLMN